MRRAGAALAALLLSACSPLPAPPAVSDNERLRVMESDALFKRALGTKVAVAGGSDSEGARRGAVQALVFDELQMHLAPEKAKAATARFARDLPDFGWTVHFVGCRPPLPADQPPLAQPPLTVSGSHEYWAFAANGYKVVEGVSYYVTVDGFGYLDGRVQVVATALAPAAAEAQSDLFADRPSAVDPQQGCLEAEGLPQALTETGTVAVVGRRANAERGIR